AYLACLYARLPEPAAWARAEELARLTAATKNPTMLGMAHVILAEVALQRGELVAAEAEARTAFTILGAFPTYRMDAVALWSRLLTRLGRPAEALAICEEMAQQIEASGQRSYALIDLYTALSEARLANGLPDGARQSVERGLVVLRFRLADLPEDAAM